MRARGSSRLYKAKHSSTITRASIINVTGLHINQFVISWIGERTENQRNGNANKISLLVVCMYREEFQPSIWFRLMKACAWKISGSFERFEGGGAERGYLYPDAAWNLWIIVVEDQRFLAILLLLEFEEFYWSKKFQRIFFGILFLIRSIT